MNASMKLPLFPAASSFKACSTNGAAARTAGWIIATIGPAPGTNIPEIVATVGSTFITASTTFSASPATVAIVVGAVIVFSSEWMIKPRYFSFAPSGQPCVYLPASVVVLEDVCFDSVPFLGLYGRAKGSVLPAGTGVVGEIDKSLFNAN